MAEPTKQATVYIVDLGRTMGEYHNGRTESDLEYGMRYIWDKIAITMAANLKGGNLGIVGLRTDETDNPLADDDDSYKNLSVSFPSILRGLLHCKAGPTPTLLQIMFRPSCTSMAIC